MEPSAHGTFSLAPQVSGLTDALPELDVPDFSSVFSFGAAAKSSNEAEAGALPWLAPLSLLSLVLHFLSGPRPHRPLCKHRGIV